MAKPQAATAVPPMPPHVVVIKIGTSTIMRQPVASSFTAVPPNATSADVSSLAAVVVSFDPDSSMRAEPATSTLALLVDTIVALKRRGWAVVLVTSGAVGMGRMEMGFTERPKRTSQKQALSAIGQNLVMGVYSELFKLSGVHVAQVLLSRSDFGARHQYTNAQNTLTELLHLGVVPIINENDSVSTQELCFGDNDTLSALVAGLVDASWLFLLTDVDRMYTADPRVNPDAAPLIVVEDVDNLQVDTGGLEGPASSGKWGTGGMATKITAARLATAAGAKVCICNGRDPLNILEYVCAGTDAEKYKELRGTVFLAKSVPIKGRKKWIAHGLVPRGAVIVDDGAAEAVLAKKSLFVAGIREVRGEFGSESAVRIINLEGKELARGLVNFSSQELDAIKGMKSKEASEVLGTDGMSAEEAIHRDNIVLM